MKELLTDAGWAEFHNARLVVFDVEGEDAVFMARLESCSKAASNRRDTALI